ncbi:bacterioferritin [Spirochaetota bacterium]|nr:bacterioferritin [Spirochaetota bacterium]
MSVEGTEKVSKLLNKALKMELTAVKQYLYNAALLRDWGFDNLAKIEVKEAYEELEHVNKFSDRILFLNKNPKFDGPERIKKVNSVEDIIKCNLSMELDAVKTYKTFIKACLDSKDYGSYKIFLDVLIDEESHVEHLMKQKNLIKTVGIEGFLHAQE